MLGLGDSFSYLECSVCRSLQLQNPPSNWDRYYPSSYYSFEVSEITPRPSIKRWFKRLATSSALKWSQQHKSKTLLNRLEIPEWMRQIPIKLTSSILDVGAGGGEFLQQLWRAGFQRLAGIDPYLAQDTSPMKGVLVRKLHMHELRETFDVVVLNHTFEHLEDGEKALRDLKCLLNPGGFIVLRIPIADSYAWANYRTLWVQLDAPRHQMLHTRISLYILTQKVGLQIAHLSCDSTNLQFWGSELYRQDKALTGAAARAIRNSYTDAQWQDWNAQATMLNDIGLGDQCCCILTLPN